MHNIKVDPIPLSDRIASISRQLSERGEGAFIELLDQSQGRLGVVVSFVAVLELMKRQIIDVIDTENNQPQPVEETPQDAQHTYSLSSLKLRWVA